MEKEKLVIKKREGDGSKIITIRIRSNTLARIDEIADTANYSRNELINRILAHGLENLQIED